MVILPRFDKYNIFQPTNLRLIFSITMTHMAIALEVAPNKRPILFIGRKETIHPRMLASCQVLWTLLTSTNSDLSKFTLKPNNASKQSKSALTEFGFPQPHRIIVYHLQTNGRY